jgi:hypothetical protein
MNFGFMRHGRIQIYDNAGSCIKFKGPQQDATLFIAQLQRVDIFYNRGKISSTDILAIRQCRLLSGKLIGAMKAKKTWREKLL